MLQARKLKYVGSSEGGHEIVHLWDTYTNFVICSWGADYGSGMTIFTATTEQIAELKKLEESTPAYDSWKVIEWIQRTLTVRQ